ncbi:MAG: right-handed parallel beta-helix repeat-containing protein [Thermodesulfobacteriota bacterium]
MSTIEQLINSLKEVLDIFDKGKLSVPVDAPADSSEVQFVGFGINAPGDPFSKGWQMTIQEASKARFIKAYCTGTIKYEKDSLNNRIILTNGDLLGQFIRQESLHSWAPIPRYVIYEWIDENSTRGVIRDYLVNNPNIVDSIYKSIGASETIEDLVQRYISNNLPDGIAVPAGQIIGLARNAGTGFRELKVYMQNELDNQDNLFLDPGFYFHHLETYFSNLSGHPLEAKFKQLFAGPIANTVVRYVSKSGSSTGPFTDHASPANLLSTALAASTPYDTIVITDNEQYSEGEEIEIALPITITSLSADSVLDNTSPALPSFDGGGAHRVIRVHNVAGVVSICNIAVMNGMVNTSQELPRSGGGILISKTHKTYIRNCHIYNNSTSTGATEDGFGGGIHFYHSSAHLYGCRINENTSAERGGGIGIWGYGWPIIEKNKIAGNKATGGGRPDGGGIGVEIAFPSDQDLTDLFNIIDAWIPEELDKAKVNRIRFIKNEINDNAADDDGGGVYLSVLSRSEFNSNIINNNHAGHAGGGVRATLASDVTMNGDYVHNNNANTKKESGNGGGGIAIRNASLFLNNVRVENNVVDGWAGGGIFFNSTTSGSSGIPGAHYDDILRTVFDAREFHLSIAGALSTVKFNQAKLAPVLGDHRMGGGIYALRFISSSFTALPIHMKIEDISNISVNVLDTTTPPPIGHPNSVEFHVEDMVNRASSPIDDSNKASFVTGTMFQYDSI